MPLAAGAISYKIWKVAKPGDVLRRTRQRSGLSQEALARRAGTTQAVVSRIERGEISPSFRTMERLLLVMGEEAQVTTSRLESDHDPAHLAAELRLTPGERLERAFAWTAFNEELRRAGSRGRG